MYEPINYDLLKSKKACDEQLNLFNKHFGVKKSIPLTKAVACKFASLFDIGWAVTNLLTSEDKAEYEKVIASAWAEYDKVIAPAWAEYDKVRGPALAEYHKVRASALAEYHKVRDQALDEYEKVNAPALAEYNKVRASALAEYEKVSAVEFVRIYKRGLTSKKSQ